LNNQQSGEIEQQLQLQMHHNVFIGASIGLWGVVGTQVCSMSCISFVHASVNTHLAGSISFGAYAWHCMFICFASLLTASSIVQHALGAGLL
jgi:hypothetical protein